MKTSNTSDINEPRDSADWSACEAGTLGGLNQRMRKAEARRFQSRLAGGALAATAAVAIVVAMLPGAGTPLGGISCQQCVALMPGYQQQLTGGESLPTEDANAVAGHLDDCPKCRGYFDRTYPGVLAASSVASLGLISFALLGTRRPHRGRQRG